MAEEDSRDRGLARLALIGAGLLILGLILWQIMDVLLLCFAAVVIANILIGIGDAIRRVVPISRGWSVGAATLFIALFLAALSVFLNAQLAGQIANLFRTIPQQAEALGNMLGIPDLFQRLTSELQSFASRGNVLMSLAGYTTGVLGIAANALLAIVAGIYLAQKPDLYRNGILALFPSRLRAYVGPTADHAGRALRMWLLGQLVSMVVVGVAVAVGLTLLGIPSALALGLFAGVAEFIPMVGPVASAVPALLLALPRGDGSVLWVLLLFVGIQQFESNLLLPLIQRRAVDLPPALTLFSLLAFSVLFGPMGLLLSTPLTVVAYVAVKELYVRDTLHEKTEIPGEGADNGNG